MSWKRWDRDGERETEREKEGERGIEIKQGCFFLKGCERGKLPFHHLYKDRISENKKG